MIKRLKVIILAVCLAVTSACGFSACVNVGDDGDKITVVTTAFPLYDWTSELLEGVENAEVEWLLDSGVDVHSYQPTVDDMVKIKNADLFVFVGGESESWVDDVLGEDNSACKIGMLDVLGDFTIEEGEPGDNHDHGEHDHEVDEHAWLSVIRAKTTCEAIADELSLLFPEQSDVIEANLTAYLGKLDALDQKYGSELGKIENKFAVFGDRFPFAYLFDDYGIEWDAAFSGCSAESEASFETIARLASRVDERRLAYVLKIEGSTHKIAESVIAASSNKNAQTLTLNSLQSVKRSDLGKTTYLSVMESNLTVLITALGARG